MTLKSALRCTALAATLLALTTAATLAQTPQHDLLNATLWMQRSVEYKANSLAVLRWPKCGSTRRWPTRTGPARRPSRPAPIRTFRPHWSSISTRR